jgi:hypothetical protein
MATATSAITTPIARWTEPLRRERSRKAPPADRQRIQHDCRTEAVAKPDRKPADSKRLDRRDRDDACQDRPRARRIDETQARAEHHTGGETFAIGGRERAARQPPERSLCASGETRHDQGHARERQDGDCERPEEAVR